MKKTAMLLLGVAGNAISAPQSVSDVAACYQAAYPHTVKAQGNSLLVNQQPIAITKSNATNYFAQLNDAGLIDQLEQPYNLNFVVPKQNEDAGRLRNDRFFGLMYGNSESAVRANLVSVNWLPSGKTIQFNRVNGAAQALENVGKEIAQYPHLVNYVSKTAGSFNYRVIKGTNRRSAHAFGVAIDFALPKGLGMYWQWSGCKEGQACKFPARLLQDNNLNQIASIFEKHGFIWGGKWYHYDSVHFEYRPELLHPQCK